MPCYISRKDKTGHTIWFARNFSSSTSYSQALVVVNRSPSTSLFWEVSLVPLRLSFAYFSSQQFFPPRTVKPLFQSFVCRLRWQSKSESPRSVVNLRWQVRLRI